MMEKIVSFKKEIEFNSIYQINSISLEHSFSINENIINGNFVLSGTYKMTESSVNLDDFSYDLPFEISIDKKYDISDISVDINDFYYEVLDNKVLSLNIEIIIDNLSLKEPTEEAVSDIEEVDDSIFEGLDSNEKYVTYKVHFVKESDSTESIIKEYNVKKSVLEEYNVLDDFKIGGKIIVPLNED